MDHEGGKRGEYNENGCGTPSQNAPGRTRTDANTG
jgi:hypothetical protein